MLVSSDMVLRLDLAVWVVDFAASRALEVVLDILAGVGRNGERISRPRKSWAMWTYEWTVLLSGGRSVGMGIGI